MARFIIWACGTPSAAHFALKAPAVSLGILIDMENHINFIVPHCLYQRFLRIQPNQIKVQRLLKTIRSVFNIIINHPHQFTTFGINCAETWIIFQISYPDCRILLLFLLLIIFLPFLEIEIVLLYFLP